MLVHLIQTPAQSVPSTSICHRNLPTVAAHQLVLVDEFGKDIGGGPIAFLTYEDGIREAIAGRGLSEREGLRAELLDRLLPMSLPLSHYLNWRERFPIMLGPSLPIACAVILAGAGAVEKTLESLNEQTHTDWAAAALPQTKTHLNCGRPCAGISDE